MMKGQRVRDRAELIIPRMGRKAMKKPGRRSQRKGRRAEFEIRDILVAAGYDAVVKGMYEPGDLLWGLCGRDRMCEVKRRHNGVSWAYHALIKNANHAVFFRADNKEWLVIQTLDQYLKDNAPCHDPPMELTNDDMEDQLAALE